MCVQVGGGRRPVRSCTAFSREEMNCAALGGFATIPNYRVRRSPRHPEASGKRMVVGAGADLAVVTEIEAGGGRDRGAGGKADDGGIALRRGAEHGEGSPRGAGERSGDRPR